MSALGALRQSPRSDPQSGWNLAGLAGRLVELSGAEDSASLTLAFGLVREAQLMNEPVAWVALETHTFYPPDAAAGGVDLDALAVIRVGREREIVHAADLLARSSAFGLIVLDLGAGRVAMSAQSRLLGLAQKHNVVLLFLTHKPENQPSLGSLIALRGQTSRRRSADDEFTCTLRVVKDKRRAPGWEHTEVCRGPSGLH